jgi:putative flippase GtrA
MAIDERGIDTGAAPECPPAAKVADPMRVLAQGLPRPVRFLAVGCLGLLCDLSIFTLIAAYGDHPLAIRLVSLAPATLVTWRLNRALTFEGSGRRQADEAIRYGAITAVAQSTSYAVFATLVLTTVLAALPQAALMCGAAIGALVSYNGHRLFAFAPRTAVKAHQTFRYDAAPEGSHRA